MLNQPPHRTHNTNIRNAALILMGSFISALIFVLGVTVGAVITRPGGMLFTGASPFPPSTGGSGLSAILPDLASSTVSDDSHRGRVDTALIDNVLQRLKTQWYGDMPADDKLTDGAIRGMVNSLGDQFTQYVEPRYAKILNENINGAFDGIGATIKQLASGDIQIIRTVPGTPAQKSGVEPGDILDAVDGKRINGLSSSEVAAMMRGERGTTVKLTLRREGKPKPFDLTLTRARIEVPLVTSKMVGPGNKIAYVSLLEFSATANDQLTKQVDELLKQNPKGLILDLRDNPGGLLNQAVQIGDLFLKKGVFVIERDYQGNQSTLDTSDSGPAQDIPMVVLVNAGSASASEIVAGAIQDYGRAKLVGETTFGKGSVQSPQNLPNGGQLRITVQRWYTPKDRGIHGTGITPDFLISNTAEDVKANKDPQMDAAVEYLNTGKTPATVTTPTPAP